MELLNEQHNITQNLLSSVLNYYVSILNILIDLVYDFLYNNNSFHFVLYFHNNLYFYFTLAVSLMPCNLHFNQSALPLQLVLPPRGDCLNSDSGLSKLRPGTDLSKSETAECRSNGISLTRCKVTTIIRFMPIFLKVNMLLLDFLTRLFCIFH